MTDSVEQPPKDRDEGPDGRVTSTLSGLIERTKRRVGKAKRRIGKGFQSFRRRLSRGGDNGPGAKGPR
jgi:hypothetical protein